MKSLIFFLVNAVVLLIVFLIMSQNQIRYLEFKTESAYRLAEEYRKIVHDNYECPPFPWYTLYDKAGKRPPHLFPDFAMNEMDGGFKDIK